MTSSSSDAVPAPASGGAAGAGAGGPSVVKVSAWAPLGIKIFRVLWLAQLGSNIGSWMQTVGAQWFLVETAAGATVIALVQTASLAPSMLLSLPAGVLADALDRRKLLIWGTLASAFLAVVLTVVSLAGVLTPVSLLAFTFVLGAAGALTAPAWQAIQPELVPREQISAAAGLGGVTVNAARAIGPALAGFLVAGLGTTVVFGVNAVSFVAAALALIWWKRAPQEGLDDRERLGEALMAGLRYVWSAGLIRRILLRSALFAFPASALWAVLPLVASASLHLDSAGYGVLLGAVGLGALIGVFVLPMARARFSDNLILGASAVLYGLGAAASALLPFALTLLLLLFAGIAWIGTLTVLNANLQLTLPQWVRARGAAVYIFVFMGTQAIGSIVWGVVAEAIGIVTALAISGVLLLLVAASVRLWPLRPGTGSIDRTTTLAWSEPNLVFDPRPEDGPVAVMVTYRVADGDIAGFVAAMHQVGASRKRTGASRWRIYESGEDANVLLESFVVPSWSEFRRQQTQRLTGRDREVLAKVLELSEGQPREEHFFPPTVHPGIARPDAAAPGTGAPSV